MSEANVRRVGCPSTRTPFEPRNCQPTPPRIVLRTIRDDPPPQGRIRKNERHSLNVIASQRVGAKRRPMTGSAKQSMLQQSK
jgi:hypothetical protein